MQCRICFDETGPFVSPCQCRGTAQYIHSKCLERYIEFYPERICHVCRTILKTPMTRREFVMLWGMCAFTNSWLWSYQGIEPAGKFLYSVLITAIYAFYYRRNIFDRGALMGIAILAVLFLTGAHPTEGTMMLSVLLTLAMFASLGKFVPPQYLMLFTIALVFVCYVFFFAYMLYRMNDRFMFTMFITTLFLYWYAWFQTVRLRTV